MSTRFQWFLIVKSWQWKHRVSDLTWDQAGDIGLPTGLGWTSRRLPWQRETTTQISSPLGFYYHGTGVQPALDEHSRHSVGGTKQVWLLTLVFSAFFVKKNFDLPGWQINDPASGKYFSVQSTQKLLSLSRSWQAFWADLAPFKGQRPFELLPKIKRLKDM